MISKFPTSNLKKSFSKLKRVLITITILVAGFSCFAKKSQEFKVIAFYTGKNDKAHISFVNEANTWFSEAGKKEHFTYESTNDWGKMTPEFLAKYDIVIFFDSRPETMSQREAFQQYIENGGAWLGFHFCAFALTPSAFPQDWDWYHNTFLGSGQYVSNTWRPTSAIIKIEDKEHQATKRLPSTFKASPNEWYRWENDLRKNPDIKILASIDSVSFPLGTGPKPHEIWHSGYYPVVWTNINYRMIYINMGHNDIDYEGGTNKELSLTFKNKIQNKLVIDALLWLGKNKR
ncbi:MAG TPA: ThuA domain-containing protein [Draconibacterium sp.]|nr:ThuA domain-containing protein [Draconibacterium sp.]